MDAAPRGPRREATNASAESGAADGESVLGRLPRSRPGRRSDKRGGRADSTVGARAHQGTSASAGCSGDRGPAPAPGASGALGPIGAAAHLTGRAARLGLNIAGDVLKRLPQP